jgi:hypothetical protein
MKKKQKSHQQRKFSRIHFSSRFAAIKSSLYIISIAAAATALSTLHSSASGLLGEKNC